MKWQCGQNKMPFAVAYRPARRRKMKKGFTLIELLVVVLIIGILSAVALPQYTIAVEKARLSEALIMMSNIEKGLEVYVMTNGIEDNDFLGNNATATLDIDIGSSLDCSGDYCLSKYFGYNAQCTFGLCYVQVHEGKSRNGEKYFLMTQRYSNGSSVHVCNGRSEIGNKICKNLQAQGWEIGQVYNGSL